MSESPLAGLTAPQYEAIKSLALGSTVLAAAQAAGVHRSTIYDWSRQHSTFRGALVKLKSDTAEFTADEIRGLASLAVDTIRQLLASEKTPAPVRLKAAQWILTSVAQSAAVHTQHNPTRSAEFPSTPAFDETQHNPTLSAEFASAPTFDETQHNPTPSAESAPALAFDGTRHNPTLSAESEPNRPQPGDGVYDPLDAFPSGDSGEYNETGEFGETGGLAWLFALPCRCGSGKKFMRCCGKEKQSLDLPMAA